MKFKKIEWRNIFAYGNEIQTIDYIDGELVLLKGNSGVGKSSILSLPALVLYGKLEKLTKSSIANRVNKNGWIRATIEKANHTYVIERTFSPNGLTVLKDNENIESFGISSAQDYIDKEIADIPIQTFSNMVSISMKKFKSFLTMSPADRKQIIDKVFNLEVINIAADHIKKDAKEISSAINSSNTTLFQLQQTVQNATNELIKIQNQHQTEDNKTEIEENNAKVQTLNDNIAKISETYQEYSLKLQESTNVMNDIRKKQYENDFNIKTINEKINLFAQSKCPTCGTSFTGAAYDSIKQQLADLKMQKETLRNNLNTELNNANTAYQQINDYLTKLNNAVYQYRNEVMVLTNKNRLIEEQSKQSAEYKGIQNIIDATTEQMTSVKAKLSEDTERLKDFQALSVLFSIEGVKQKVIANYLPILNSEIAKNLEMLLFPYDLVFDNKFEPDLRELSISLAPETLSDGEQTRVDLVIMCSLFKLLKRRFPSINILFIDEVISSLDNETSGLVLDFLKTFAKDNGLACFIVSHTDLYMDNFDKIINVSKKGFSRIEVTAPFV